MNTALEQLEHWIEQYKRINGTPPINEILTQIDLLKDYEKEQCNVLYMLLYAFKMRFNNYCEKIANRITCTHEDWEGVYCLDTRLFMYKRCKKCGKKSCRP